MRSGVLPYPTPCPFGMRSCRFPGAKIVDDRFADITNDYDIVHQGDFIKAHSETSGVCSPYIEGKGKCCHAKGGLLNITRRELRK